MISLLQFVFWAWRITIRSREQLAAENLVLRHQLNIVCRRYPKPIRRLHGAARVGFICLPR